MRTHAMYVLDNKNDTGNKRIKLHEKLCDILGSRNCYFSPPSNIRMCYPCFVYEEDSRTVRHADNRRYFNKKRYSLTVIDENPDSSIPDKLFESDFLYLRHDRTYVVDGMYHFVYTLYN